MDYKLTFEEGDSSLFAYKKASNTFTISTDLDAYLNGEFSLGTYSALMEFNAKASSDFSGSFIGVEAIEGGAGENFY